MDSKKKEKFEKKAKEAKDKYEQEKAKQTTSVIGKKTKQEASKKSD
jgi:hypothetical protein